MQLFSHYNPGMPIIYKIKSPSGKLYVGVTSRCIVQRLSEHRSHAKFKRGSPKLTAEMKLYGADNFTVEAIEECSELTRWVREKFWITKLGTFKNGLNDSLGGRGANGRVANKEERELKSTRSKQMWADPAKREKLTKARAWCLQDHKLQSEKGTKGGIARAAKQPWFKVYCKKTGKLIGRYNTWKAFADQLGVCISTAERYLTGKLKVGRERYKLVWEGGSYQRF